MISIKRVILADGSRLVREMLHHAIGKADHLKVVGELTDYRDIPGAIEKFNPEWVIVSTSFSQRFCNSIHEHPAVRFIFLSPDINDIKMKWQTSYEENLSGLSLKDFIHILEKDLEHT
jgi:DNA-binding NarL/FixJ family response regulator